MKKKLLFWISILSIAAGALSAATPPDVVHFQGVLMSGGAPLTGPYDVEFRYWDAPVAGSLLLVEIHDGANAVVVDNGVFQVELGAADRIVPGGGAYDTLAAVFANSADVHLEITVGADPPMQPRVHMAASAYALNARSLEGKRADEFLDTSETYQVKAGGLQVPFMRAENFGYGVQIPGEPYPYANYGLHAYGEEGAGYFEAPDGFGVEAHGVTAGYFDGEYVGIQASASLGTGGDFYGSQQGLTVYSLNLGIGTWGDVIGGDFFGGELGLWGQSDAVGVKGTGATMGGYFTHPVEGGEAKLGFGPTGGYFFGTPAIQAEGEIAQLGAAPAEQRSALFGSTGFFRNNSTSVSLARVQQNDMLTETGLEALSSQSTVLLADQVSGASSRVTGGRFEETATGSKAELAVNDTTRGFYGAAGVFTHGSVSARLATDQDPSGVGLYAGYFDGDVAVTGELEVPGGIRFDDGSLQTMSTTASLCTGLTGNPACNLLDAIVEASHYPPNFAEAVSAPGNFIQPDVAIGVDNNPIVAYWKSGAPEGGLIAHCLDSSCSAVETTTIEELDHAGGVMSIVVPLDGNPLVAAYSDYNLELVQCHNPSCTHYEFSVLVEGPGHTGLLPSMAINYATGNPLICYYHTDPAELRVLACTDSACSTHDSPISLDGAGDVGRDCAIAVPADGNLPIISYWDATNRNLKAVRCTSYDCSTFDPPTVVDSSGNIAGNTAIAIGQDGYPLISYNDDGGNLKLADCENDACTIRTLRTLDNSGGVSGRTSVVVPDDGRPIVSYYYAWHSSLWVTRCVDPDCVEIMSIPAEPVPELIAPWTAMALGADDKPVIAYQDIDNSQIRTITHLTILDEEFKSGSFAAAQSSEPSEESALASGSYPTTRIDETRAGPLEDAICGDRRSDRRAAMERITLVQVNGPAETGDVLVIAPEHPGVMRVAQDAANPAVLGIVAPKPDGTGATEVRDSTRMDSLKETIRDVPVVFSGITPCKVDAGYGEIRPGDLLTTSPTPGHAMRVLDPLPGTILGKALEPLETGTGMIKILVTLR